MPAKWTHITGFKFQWYVRWEGGLGLNFSICFRGLTFMKTHWWTLWKETVWELLMLYDNYEYCEIGSNNNKTKQLKKRPREYYRLYIGQTILRYWTTEKIYKNYFKVNYKLKCIRMRIRYKQHYSTNRYEFLMVQEISILWSTGTRRHSFMYIF